METSAMSEGLHPRYSTRAWKMRMTQNVINGYCMQPVFELRMDKEQNKYYNM